MTLPRAAQIDSSSYSARRIIFIWIALCVAGWAMIFLAVRTVIVAVEMILA
jgi:hypothetical protein